LFKYWNWFFVIVVEISQTIYKKMSLFLILKS
jgi:hypothetical protein